MATVIKTGGRQPVTSGKLMMSRFRGAIIDKEAGEASGFRLLVPLEHGRRTGFLSLNISDIEAENFVRFYNDQVAKGLR